MDLGVPTNRQRHPSLIANADLIAGKPARRGYRRSQGMPPESVVIAQGLARNHLCRRYRHPGSGCSNRDWNRLP